ncbi:MAG TPA: 3-deoxy-D-manno-octulosonic acid transferase [Candidatus Saccharimonadales bacterium]|jgi:3-deoxy-D-manno-octulosonic-acid transferase|nr:3-deoxy-D-manno-octulosonic acid transferase [Candidatus Saccharimonadales bacterium]
MHILYTLLLGLLVLLSLPWWIFQMVRSGKYRYGLTERLGLAPARLPQIDGPPSIWIHAVSVGEVLAITRLVEQLKEKYPQHPVFISTTTLTGHFLAGGRFGEDCAFFVPIDFGFAIRPYLQRLQPALLVLAETEFWPNLLHLVKKSGAAIAVVNARISDRSFPRYRRFRWFFRPVLAGVDLFLAQTEEDARRLVAIGAPVDRVRVSGNLKFDMLSSPDSELARDLRVAISHEAPLIVCGSTAEGEEVLLLAAFRKLQQEFPEAVMVLAPRHPERFDKVAELAISMQLTLTRRCKWNRATAVKAGVFLLDSVGELASVYALADIAFVGGSLVPLGGHNILEPAQHGVAVMTGLHTFNFREIVRIFSEGDALKITSPEMLAHDLGELIRSPEERQALGKRAQELFLRNAGATERTAQALRPLLEKAGDGGLK